MSDRTPTPSRLWIKLDALIHRNPKTAQLSDGQFRAYLVSLCEAKVTQSEGEWPSREHYTYAVGPKVARHLPALLEAGLLEESADGWIGVHDWTEWQPKDPTAAARSKRYRDRKRDGTSATRDATDRHIDRGEEKQEERGDADRVASGGLSAVATDGACPGCGQVPKPGDPTTTDASSRPWHVRCPERAAA